MSLDFVGKVEVEKNSQASVVGPLTQTKTNLSIDWEKKKKILTSPPYSIRASLAAKASRLGAATDCWSRLFQSLIVLGRYAIVR